MDGIKMTNKEEKQRRKNIIRMNEMVKQFPDKCFCENHLFSEDDIVEKYYKDYYLGNSQTSLEFHIYKCSKCGKKYNDEPIYYRA